MLSFSRELRCARKSLTPHRHSRNPQPYRQTFLRRVLQKRPQKAGMDRRSGASWRNRFSHNLRISRRDVASLDYLSNEVELLQRFVARPCRLLQRGEFSGSALADHVDRCVAEMRKPRRAGCRGFAPARRKRSARHSPSGRQSGARLRRPPDCASAAALQVQPR